MSAAEQTKEVVELAVGYTKQIVEALTPLAKQAYEIGLVTLQVDAAASLFYGFLGCLPAFLTIGACIWVSKTRHVPDGERIEAALCTAGAGSVVSFLAILMVGYQFLSVWLWVKLFSPELWLAHQAVEKLLK
jgi:hypothetical protein